MWSARKQGRSFPAATAAVTDAPGLTKKNLQDYRLFRRNEK